ncbi:MAG: sel1 repeat family protein [Rhodospirillaceae bacterium]|nr:sel1 repeat family protein [Rhodospirillaceae bacterium]
MALLVVSCAPSGELVERSKTDTEEIDSTAIKVLQNLARAGDTSAQIKLGGLYLRGEGVNQNHKLAFKWIKSAADFGKTEGMYLVGLMYEGGHGVERNYKLAFKWYSRAAEIGFGNANLRLGGLYENGHGTPRNRHLAFDKFKLDADKGVPEASVKLAQYYLLPRQKDFVRAHMWLGIAQSQMSDDWLRLGNHKKGTKGDVERLRRKIENKMSSEQIVTANRRADEWINTGKFSWDGLGGSAKIGLSDSLKELRHSAARSEATALFSLGAAFELGDVVEQDFAEAYKWYYLASQKDPGNATYSLALFKIANRLPAGDVIEGRRRAEAWGIERYGKGLDPVHAIFEPGSLELRLTWGGFRAEVAGKMTTKAHRKFGDILLQMSSGTVCPGEWKYERGKYSGGGELPVGSWMVDCGNGNRASGSYVSFTPTTGAGEGVDGNKNKVIFRFGYKESNPTLFQQVDEGVLCRLGTEYWQSSTWDRRVLAKEFVDEAKRRGLDAEACATHRNYISRSSAAIK